MRALVIASGFALALAFPKSDVSLLAWVAFVPFFYAVEGVPLKNVFWWGWLQGLACYVGSLYWVVITLHEFAGVHFVLSLLPMLLLAGVVGFYTALALWTGEFTARRLRLPIVLTMPIAWAAVELVRTYFPIGFPWNLLGETQYRNLGADPVRRIYRHLWDFRAHHFFQCRGFHGACCGAARGDCRL